MTISSSSTEITHDLDGISTGPFEIPWRFLKASEIVAVHTSDGVATPISPSDYTVTGAGAGAGQLTLNNPYSNGDKLTIGLNMDFVQEVDFKPNDPLPAETIETAFDRLTLLAKQLKNGLDRAIVRALGGASYDLQNARLKNVAVPVDPTDAATKQYIDSLVLATGNIPPPAAIDDGLPLVTNGEVFDWDQIDGRAVKQNSIAAGHIEAGAVTNDKIAAGQISLDKLAHIASSKIIGRSAAGDGPLQLLSCSAIAQDMLSALDAISIRSLLGLGSVATQSADNVNITGGTITGVSGLDTNWIPLDFKSASGSSYLDFAPSSSYGAIVFLCRGIRPSVAADFFIRLSDSQATGVDSGASAYAWQLSEVRNTTETHLYDNADSSVPLMKDVVAVSSHGYSGLVYIYRRSGRRPMISHDGRQATDDGSVVQQSRGAGFYRSSDGSAVDAVRFQFADGRTISEGQIAMYGIKTA